MEASDRRRQSYRKAESSAESAKPNNSNPLAHLLSSLAPYLPGQSVLSQARTRTAMTGSAQSHEESVLCVQCAKTVQKSNALRLSDGRMLCRTCARNKPDSGQGYFELASRLRHAFEKTFACSLPQPIAIRFSRKASLPASDIQEMDVRLSAGRPKIACARQSENENSIWVAADLPRAECIFALAQCYCALYEMEFFDQQKLRRQARSLSRNDAEAFLDSCLGGLRLYCAWILLENSGLASYARRLMQECAAGKDAESLEMLKVSEVLLQSFPNTLDADGHLEQSPLSADPLQVFKDVSRKLHSRVRRSKAQENEK